MAGDLGIRGAGVQTLLEGADGATDPWELGSLGAFGGASDH